MNLHDERLFIEWVVDVLDTGGLTVGDSEAPVEVPDGTGYVVVYSIGGGVTGGTIYDPQDDATVNVQVTSSGVRPEQARWLATTVRELMVAAVPATLEGNREVIWIDFTTGGVPVIREDEIQPPRFMAPDRMVLGTVPA